jgi:hypothetical protein
MNKIEWKKARKLELLQQALDELIGLYDKSRIKSRNLKLTNRNIAAVIMDKRTKEDKDNEISVHYTALTSTKAFREIITNYKDKDGYPKLEKLSKEFTLKNEANEVLKLKTEIHGLKSKLKIAETIIDKHKMNRTNELEDVNRIEACPENDTKIENEKLEICYKIINYFIEEGKMFVEGGTVKLEGYPKGIDLLSIEEMKNVFGGSGNIVNLLLDRGEKS